MISLERSVGRFWDRIAAHVDIPPESLGIFRWIFGLSTLAILAPYSAWIHSVPTGLFNPPIASPAELFRGFPPAPTFLILDIVVLISLACITVGYRTRLSSLVFVVANIVASNFKFSFGKMDRDFLPTALIACMMVSDWGAYYSFDAARHGPDAETPRRTVKSMALLGVLVAFGMFSAGLPKALKWIDFDTTTSGFLSWFLPNYFSIGRSFLLASLSLRMPPLLAEAADYTSALFELCGFVALLYSRRAWLAFLAAATAFHLMNSLVLNIPFHDQVIVYLAFIDWSQLLAPFRAARQRKSQIPVLLTLLVAVLTAWHIYSRIAGHGSSVAFFTNTVDTEVFDLFVSVPISILALALFVRAIATERPHAERVYI